MPLICESRASPVPPKPPRPVHPLLAGQGSNVDGIVGGVDIGGGGGRNEGGTPQFHLPPAYLSPHARYRAPLIRFAGRILTYRRPSRRGAFIGTTLAGEVRYVWGGSKEQSCLVIGQSPPLVVCLSKARVCYNTYSRAHDHSMTRTGRDSRSLARARARNAPAAPLPAQLSDRRQPTAPPASQRKQRRDVLEAWRRRWPHKGKDLSPQIPPAHKAQAAVRDLGCAHSSAHI